MSLIKLTDIAGRSLFVLIILYSLPTRSSGQFGLVLSLIGLFAFLSGFERYVDLQRTLIGKTDKEADQFIFSSLQFFCVNYLLWIPILALLLYSWVDISTNSVMLCLLIAIGEHIANEFYRIALITRRYRSVLIVGMVKNIVLLGIVSHNMFTSSNSYDLNQFLTLWAALSVLGFLISAGIFIQASIWMRELRHCDHLFIFEQFRRSATHFKIGLMAVLALQADRLIAGGLLPLEDAGIYFRHIFLAAAVYQMLGVVSHNRIMARVYGGLHACKPSQVLKILIHEKWRYVLLMLGLIGIVLFVSPLAARDFAFFKNITPYYLAVLMFAYLLRGLADYKSMILNAFYKEQQIFKSQLITVFFTSICSILLAPLFGIPGLIMAVLAGATIYLLFTSMFAYRIMKLKLKKERL